MGPKAHQRDRQRNAPRGGHAHAEPAEIAAVIQCGGRGERLAFPGPKPLVDLGGGKRPLSNLLRDIPAHIPVYLHLLREHKEVFGRFLEAEGNFGHRISYLIQQEGFLYDRDCVPMRHPDGTWITASNGPATFSRHFAVPPAGHFLIIDGAKVGLCTEDFQRALKSLRRSRGTEILAFARELDRGERRQESARLKAPTEHPRYARANAGKQRVFEHPHIPARVVADGRWMALAGVYIASAARFIHVVEALTNRTEAIEHAFRTAQIATLKDSQVFRANAGDLRAAYMASRSADALFKGGAFHLKVAMTLFGYNSREQGLRFDLHLQDRKTYIPGIKDVRDVEAYAKWERRRLFDYRDWS